MDEDEFDNVCVPEVHEKINDAEHVDRELNEAVPADFITPRNLARSGNPDNCADPCVESTVNPAHPDKQREDATSGNIAVAETNLIDGNDAACVDNNRGNTGAAGGEAIKELPGAFSDGDGERRVIFYKASTSSDQAKQPHPTSAQLAERQQPVIQQISTSWGSGGEKLAAQPQGVQQGQKPQRKRGPRLTPEQKQWIEAKHEDYINVPTNQWRKYDCGYAEREWFDGALAEGITEGLFTSCTKAEALRSHIREHVKR